MDDQVTISLLFQAAKFLELEAEDLNCRPSDHYDRSKTQLQAIAMTNLRLANAIRKHITKLQVTA